MHERWNQIGLLLVIGMVIGITSGWSLAAEEKIEPGFTKIFNGKDMTDWDGDPRLWKVVDGVIRGETTPENPTKGNTFCVWRGGKLKNFILKIKFRIQNGNSGIQYRSKEHQKWRINGYQAEVENAPGKVGFLYHEGGRAWLVNVGDIMEIDKEGKKNVVGKVSDVEALKKAGYYKMKDWNEYTIVARGNHLIHYLNDYPMMELIDNDRVVDPKDMNDRKGALLEGVLALQIHAGPPMIVDFKDIRIKHLPDHFGKAVQLFNGKDLDGWTFSSENVKAAWSVKDGILVDEGNPGGYIRTMKDYTNYVLRMQLRHTSRGNGGVLLRMVGPDKVWPRSIEAQGQSDAKGDIWNIDNFPMKADPTRTRGRHTRKMHKSNEKPIGQWNEYDILMDKGTLELYVNGLLQNAATDCWETPGKICLQAEGSKMEFRNIVLIPIEKKEK
jgi:3-keto-disaccharide hydrolase